MVPHPIGEVVLAGAGLLVGLILLALAIYETRFVLHLWRASGQPLHPEDNERWNSAEKGGRRNDLWRALFVRNAMIVACCSWLLAIFVIRFLWGPQDWAPPVNIVVTILLLLGPTIVGVQLRHLRDD